MSSNIIKTKGIIIKEVPEKEYDKLLTIITPSYGKIKAWVKSCRKVNSHNLGKARNFVFADFELTMGKNMYNLIHIDTIEIFNELLSKTENTFFAFYFTEIVEYISFENIESADIVKLLYYSFKALINDNISNRLVRRIFELKILQYNGTYEDSNNINTKLKYTWDYILAKSPELLYNFKLSDELLSDFEKVVDGMFNKYIERKFNSRRYLI